MPQEMELVIEEAQLTYLNFEGREDTFNKAGDRNFSVILNPELAQQMIDDGWNVKVREPQDEGDPPFYYIQVAVGYKFKPPQIYTLTAQTRVRSVVGESEVANLDYADYTNVDLIIRGREWEVNGKTGVKAYLKKMFMTLNEDALDLKYAEFMGDPIDD